MHKKEKDLLELHSYIESVDKEVTMLLQSLQWDRKHVLEGSTLVPCRYDATHKVPPDKKESHETECLLRCEGYTKEDVMLPDPLDPEAPTVVKLSKEDIQQIINNAAQADPSLKKGVGSAGREPLTADRLRACYSADERRAIHDAIVSTAPDFEHIEDIDLSSTGVKQEQRRKSKLEVLAELRDMRRRRAKYRGAALASKNYSNVLRDLIKTQMELYTGTSVDSVPQSNPSTSRQTNYDKRIHIKQEPTSDEESGHTREHPRKDRYAQRNDDKDYRRNRNSRDYINRSHRDSTERHQYRQDRDRNRHTRTYGKTRRGDVHIKEEPTSDGDDYRREVRKERESSHREHREERRHKDRPYERNKHSKSNERNVNDSNQSKTSGGYSDSRRKESTYKRYSRDSGNGHSKSKTRRENSDNSFSTDPRSSRKHKHGEDYGSSDESRLTERHYRTKYRERSRSKAKERDAETDREGKDDMYKRYYAMKRALANKDSKRKKYS